MDIGQEVINVHGVKKHMALRNRRKPLGERQETKEGPANRSTKAVRETRTSEKGAAQLQQQVWVRGREPREGGSGFRKSVSPQLTWHRVENGVI